MAANLSISAAGLARLLGRLCPPARIDLAGAVGLPCGLPHAEAWRDYVASGRHAGLEYLSRDLQRRADPALVNPWARSMLVFGQRYTDGWAEGASPDEAPDVAHDETPAGAPAWIHGVARYARGLDYHDVMLADVRTVLAGLGEVLPGLRAHPAVDTGPYLERELAWLAGLGFWGKNTCLIHERLGSGFFLAVAPTSLLIEGLGPDGEPAAEPLYGVVPRARRERGTRAGRSPMRHASLPPGVSSRCGRCRACLDACPTGALEAPFRLDARKCISTWTIEWRGRAPAAQRALQGEQLFGCDICQAVCPWNQLARDRLDEPDEKPLESPRQEYRPLPDHSTSDLAALIAIGTAEFRRRFRRTPLWRAHPEGMRRNALLVGANTGCSALRQLIAERADKEPDEETRGVARWASDRCGDRREQGG
jgi:epoxyqueuosine reductase